MKQLVKINAKNYKSHYGYIVDGDECVAVIKVACREDWNRCLEREHCILLGRYWVEEINEPA